jgi:hypothetical protein
LPSPCLFKCPASDFTPFNPAFTIKKPETIVREDKNHLAAAVLVARADTLTLADLHAGLSVVRRRSAHTLLNLASHGKERLLDVAGVLCRSLEEGDAQAVGELLQRELAL